MGKKVLTKYVRDLANSVMRGVRLCWVAACQRRIALKKVRELHQHKRPLRVAFLLYELPFWKNEPLFKAMEADERFIPAFWLTDAPRVANDEVRQEIRNACKEYVRKHNFLYYDAASLQELRQQFAPDFLFVVQPYDFMIPFAINELKGILPIFVPYGFSNMATNLVYEGWKLKYFYRYYVESAYIQQKARKYLKNKARNTRVTGLPMADWLLNSKVERTEGRKRIIWPPHWTVRNMERRALNVSTFLLIADDMLKIAQKYAEQVELVLTGEDPLAEKRAAFLQSYLCPNNQSPVQNIITDLLNP